MSGRGAPAAYREPTTAAATPSIHTPSIVGWTANAPASSPNTATLKVLLNDTVLLLAIPSEFLSVLARHRERPDAGLKPD